MSIYDEMNNELIYETYRQYVDEHRKNVLTAFEWLCNNVPEVIALGDINEMFTLMQSHDESKYSREEFEPYAIYFYGPETKTDEVLTRFDYAWNHHQKMNPHHWQYWVLQNDEDGAKPLDMPFSYIVEMVCDHWSFSFKQNNLKEIFNWYTKNKDKMILSDETRNTYEIILGKIKEKL